MCRIVAAVSRPPSVSRADESAPIVQSAWRSRGPGPVVGGSASDVRPNVRRSRRGHTTAPLHSQTTEISYEEPIIGTTLCTSPGYKRPLAGAAQCCAGSPPRLQPTEGTTNSRTVSRGFGAHRLTRAPSPRPAPTCPPPSCAARTRTNLLLTRPRPRPHSRRSPRLTPRPQSYHLRPRRAPAPRGDGYRRASSRAQQGQVAGH